ncbi:hypothetical protein AB1K70_06400 [Bremerella sp. JC770]|uniref:hypothetical protein n=1 Tax=Bremerella sp. JC770 TaxID=3232137 RepID=UPI00345780A3
MANDAAVLVDALDNLLREIVDGPPDDWAFILNAGDPGLVKQLEMIDAHTASQPSPSGRSTIAAHVDHVWYSIHLLNRWSDGEANPWATADWEASWQHREVTPVQWTELREKLQRECQAWRKHVKSRESWEPIEASATLASMGHLAYHLGAIRQILHSVTGKAKPSP